MEGCSPMQLKRRCPLRQGLHVAVHLAIRTGNKKSVTSHPVASLHGGALGDPQQPILP